VEVGGVTGLVLDMTGTGPHLAVQGPLLSDQPVARAKEEEAPRGPPQPPKYTVPEGWQEKPPTLPGVPTFQVGEGDRAARVTLTAFPGTGGGLRKNIERWRDEVLLPRVAPKELDDNIQWVQVSGAKAAYVELIGPEAKGPRKGVLGVIASHGGHTWFFKM